MSQGIYDSPLGEILVRWQGEALNGLDFVSPEEGLPLEPIPEKLKTWLDVYFSGRDPGPAPMNLDPAGTPFQRRVWQAMAAVPYGETTTYGQLAAQVMTPGKNPGFLARAVGRAVGANPILILLPCHRVLGAGGKLTGFRAGLERKKWLLAGEGSLPGQYEKNQK